MKRISRVLIVLLFFLTTVFFIPNVESQEVELTEFEKSYQIYKLTIEDYNKKHKSYVLARAQYLRFQTLKSKEDAQNATIVMLQARDEVIISYLMTLRNKIEESGGIDDLKRSELLIKIDEETGWFSDHKASVPSAITLNDLVRDSEKANKRYTEVTPLFYEVLSHVSTSKLVEFEERYVTIFAGVQDKVGEIQAETRDEYRLGEEKSKLIDQWIFETQSRLDRSGQKLQDINDTLLWMSDNKKVNRNDYERLIVRLTEMRQHLKEAGAFAKEVLVEIMTLN